MSKEQLRRRIEKIEWMLDLFQHIEKGGEIELYKNWSEWRVYDVNMNELNMDSDPDKWRKKPESSGTAEITTPLWYKMYYIPCLDVEEMYLAYRWEGTDVDMRHLSRKLIHKNVEDAIEHAMELLGMDNEY